MSILIGIGDVVAAVRCSPALLRDLEREGVLPAPRRGGRYRGRALAGIVLARLLG